MIRLRLSLDQSSRQIDMVDSNAWKRSFLKVDLVVVVGLDSSFGIKFLDQGENLHPIRHFPEKKGNCMPEFCLLDAAPGADCAKQSGILLVRNDALLKQPLCPVLEFQIFHHGNLLRLLHEDPPLLSG